MASEPTRHRLLVAEDDPATAALLCDILETEGFDVATAPDGNRALAAIERRPPDAIVLDIMMPERDGLSVLRGLRSRLATRPLPVVILTARADSSTKWSGWQAGCDYYITKPFDPEELITILNRLLSRERPGSAA